MYLVIISLASLYKKMTRVQKLSDVAFYLPNYNSHFTKVAHNYVNLHVFADTKTALYFLR